MGAFEQYKTSGNPQYHKMSNLVSFFHNESFGVRVSLHAEIKLENKSIG